MRISWFLIYLFDDDVVNQEMRKLIPSSPEFVLAPENLGVFTSVSFVFIRILFMLINQTGPFNSPNLAPTSTRACAAGSNNTQQYLHESSSLVTVVSISVSPATTMMINFVRRYSALEKVSDPKNLRRRVRTVRSKPRIHFRSSLSTRSGTSGFPTSLSLSSPPSSLGLTDSS